MANWCNNNIRLIGSAERIECLISGWKKEVERDGYLSVLKDASRSQDHQHEVERVLKLVFDKCNVATLKELTADAVQQYVTSLKCSAATKNKHRVYVVGFMNFLVGAGRIPSNPITKFSVRHSKPKANYKKRERRALTPDELTLLFRAALEYPVKTRLIHKGGRPRRDGTPAQIRKPVTLKPETLAALGKQGQERQLMYKLAVFTGLRRGELSRLKVGYLDFAGLSIHMPETATKNGRAATIHLVPMLAEMLRNWTHGKQPDDKVISVPNKSNLHKLHLAVLKLAGIEYKVNNRHADFHSMRTTTNTYLARQGVDGRQRDLFLRHAMGSMKDQRYDGRHEMDAALNALARLWVSST